MADKYRGTKSGARKLTMFANCSNPASPILIVEGSVYTRNILSFIPAEDIDHIKLISDFIFDFTAAGVVPCGGRKTSPRTSTIVQFIFYFGPLSSAIIF